MQNQSNKQMSLQWLLNNNEQHLEFQKNTTAHINSPQQILVNRAHIAGFLTFLLLDFFTIPAVKTKKTALSRANSLIMNNNIRSAILEIKATDLKLLKY